MARGVSKKTTTLISTARELLEAENPMTLRQLFYRLVSVHALENSRAAYQRLSRIMTTAREAGDVDPALMVDRSKPEIIPNVWHDTAAYLLTVANSYRRDYWEDQPYCTEVWIEKDSLTGSIEGVVAEHGVTLRAHRGYGSTTKKMEIAAQFDATEKPIVIFYIGDFDPSGMDIERDLLAKISRYQRTKNVPTVIRLGVLKEDIAQFDLPPLKMKTSDPRATSFEARYGVDVVEADALPPAELRRRIADSISSLIDFDLWEHKMITERAEMTSIRNFAATFKVRQVSL